MFHNHYKTIFIGKLALKISWTNLYGAEFLITLEDIYLVVQPNAQVAYDALKEEKREYERKLQQLLAVENAKKLEAEKGQTVYKISHRDSTNIFR